MDKLAIVVDDVNWEMRFGCNAFEVPLIQNARKIVLIFVEKTSLVPINCPIIFRDTIKFQYQNVKRRRARKVLYLSELEFNIKAININLEITKLILTGKALQKVKSCVEKQNIKSAIIYKSDKNMGFFRNLIYKPIERYFSEDLKMNVVIINKGASQNGK